MKRDWHIHTTFSDGSDTIEEILQRAKTREVKSIAITNHDTTLGINEAIEAGKLLKIKVVGGVEVSAWDFARGRKAHILGLGLSGRTRALNELCLPLLQQRNENSQRQIDRLLEAGYELDINLVKNLSAESPAIYKQHIMAGLTEAPFTSMEYGILYNELFKNGGICERNITYVDARDAVRAIVEDGGLAVLAHPGKFDNYALVPELVKCGLTGIERDHPEHNDADKTMCDELQKRFNLFASSGSDYHGNYGKIPYVGFGIN